MPPKRPAAAKAAKSGNGEKATKRRKKAPAKAAPSSDSEFDSDVDNGNGNHAEVVDGSGDTAVDEVVDESLYPKEPAIVGRLLISGGTNWDLVGRKELPKSAKNAPNACTGKLVAVKLSKLI